MESVKKKKKKEHDDEEEVIHIFGRPDKMPIPPPPLWSRARAPTRQVLHFLSLFISVHTDRHTYTYKHIDKSEKKERMKKEKKKSLAHGLGVAACLIIGHHRRFIPLESYTHIYIFFLFFI